MLITEGKKKKAMNQDTKPPNQNELGHILVVSSPLQGHAAPLIKLSHKITKLGMKVTFLTMDLKEARAVADAMADAETGEESENRKRGLRIISVPSGLEVGVGGGWKDMKLVERIHAVIPIYLEELLSGKGSERISGVIVDSPLAWMLGIPKKMGLKTAVYWCSNAGCLALGFKIPQLLQSEFFDDNGTPLKNETIKLLPNMPDMRASDLMWNFPSDRDMQKTMFHAIKAIIHHMTTADWILGNWFHHLDPAAAAISPNILPVGPLLADDVRREEDSTCLSWLDTHPPSSVIYVAFGSTSRFSRRQLDELAAGLELMGRPFLWAAWSGLIEEGPSAAAAYCGEFAARVAGRGLMVEWAPQEAVLRHGSTACFVTHCGWNSFVESLSNGVPVLCWPYFGDQMYTQRCACDGWNVGLRLNADGGDGIVSRDEIKRRVEEIMGDGIVRENALRFREMGRASVGKGGTSSLNLDSLLQQMKYYY